MNKALSFTFALGVVMGLALSVTSAQANNRPTDGNLLGTLNGEVSRDLNTGGGTHPLADGGGLSTGKDFGGDGHGQNLGLRAPGRTSTPDARLPTAEGETDTARRVPSSQVAS